MLLMENSEKQPVVEIVYYVPDKRKDSGSYQTRSGTVKRIDTQRKTLIFAGGDPVQIENIYSIRILPE